MELNGQSAVGTKLPLEANRLDEWLRELRLNLLSRRLLIGIVATGLTSYQPPEGHFLQRANLGTAEGLGKLLSRDLRLGNLTPAVSERLIASVTRVEAGPSGSSHSQVTPTCTVRNDRSDAETSEGERDAVPVVMPLTLDQRKMLEEDDPLYIDGMGRTQKQRKAAAYSFILLQIPDHIRNQLETTSYDPDDLILQLRCWALSRALGEVDKLTDQLKVLQKSQNESLVEYFGRARQLGMLIWKYQGDNLTEAVFIKHLIYGLEGDSNFPPDLVNSYMNHTGGVFDTLCSTMSHLEGLRLKREDHLKYQKRIGGGVTTNVVREALSVSAGGGCTHCGKTNHTSDRCWSLPGNKPSWLKKRYGQRGQSGGGRGNGQSGGGQSGGWQSGGGQSGGGQSGGGRGNGQSGGGQPGGGRGN